MTETRDLDTRAHGPPPWPRPRPPSRLALCISIAAGRGGLWSLCGAFCGELAFPPFPLSFCFPLLDSSGSLPYCGGEEGGRAAFLPYGVSSAPPPLAAGECCTWTFPCENARACVSHAPPRPRPRGSRHTKSFPPGPRRATQSQWFGYSRTARCQNTRWQESGCLLGTQLGRRAPSPRAPAASS